MLFDGEIQSSFENEKKNQTKKTDKNGKEANNNKDKKGVGKKVSKTNINKKKNENKPTDKKK